MRCPGCGQPLASQDDVCPRCSLAQSVPPSVSPRAVEVDGDRLRDRRSLIGPDREVRWSLRMLLVFVVGLILLLFAVTAAIVGFLFAR